MQCGGNMNCKGNGLLILHLVSKQRGPQVDLVRGRRVEWSSACAS